MDVCVERIFELCHALIEGNFTPPGFIQLDVRPTVQAVTSQQEIISTSKI
jgi:hypothetical protein